MALDLMRAVLEVQRAAPKLVRDKKNEHFGHKYLTLEALMEQVLPILNGHELVWLTFPGRDETNHPALHYRLVHVPTGKDLRGAIPLMVQKGTPQEQGSALTYARRYALMALLGLVADEDDDGNAATAAAKSEATLPTAPTSAPVTPSQVTADHPILEAAIKDLTAKLQKYPEEWAKVEGWAKERGLDLATPGPAKLRAVESALRKKLDSITKAAA